MPSNSKELFELTACIEEVISIMKNSYDESEISIQFSKQAGLSLLGYKEELQQVLINLLNNAKDAIISNKTKEKSVKIHCSSEDKTIKISVEDSGGGIPSEIKDRIFEPYFTTKFKSQGTGIGLYMSKMIIEKSFKGTLYMENISNGSRFIIELDK